MDLARLPGALLDRNAATAVLFVFVLLSASSAEFVCTRTASRQGARRAPARTLPCGGTVPLAPVGDPGPKPPGRSQAPHRASPGDAEQTAGATERRAHWPAAESVYHGDPGRAGCRPHSPGPLPRSRDPSCPLRRQAAVPQVMRMPDAVMHLFAAIARAHGPLPICFAGCAPTLP